MRPRTNAELQIVAGGGWVTRHVVARAKARFFTFLSVIWLPVAAVGGFLSPFSPDGAAFAGAWLYGLAVILEVIFIALAVLFWLMEEPRPVKEQRQNLNSDPRKLY